jgi:hypothetical protein
MGRRRIADYPWAGHYDTWLLDKQKRLVEMIFDEIIYPGHRCASDYRATPETFQTVALHDQELHEELAKVNLPDGTKKKFSPDMKCLCQAAGTQAPFLPVHGEHECKLFTALMLEKKKCDVRGFCIEFIRKTDGVNIFPKLEVHIRTYLKQWQRNQRIQDAVKRMKVDLVVLENINQRHLPAELSTVTGNGNRSDDDGNGSSGSGDGGCPVMLDGNVDQDETMLTWPSAQQPDRQEEPIERARIAAGTSTHVGTLCLGATSFSLSALNQARAKYGRGKDTKKRHRRRCKLCLQFGNNEQQASECNGKGGRKRCQHFDENGDPK